MAKDRETIRPEMDFLSRGRNFGISPQQLLEHRLRGIRNLRHRAESVLSNTKKEKEHTHNKRALKTSGYAKWPFVKSTKRPDEDRIHKGSNIIVPYVARVSEKFRRIFYKHDFPVHFKPSNTPRTKTG